MARLVVVLVGFVGVMVQLVTAAAAAANGNGIECKVVSKEVGPCLGFLKGKGDVPCAACCRGLKKISKALQERKSRTEVCKCIKKTLRNVGSYNPKLMPLLPHKCKVAHLHIPPIDAKTNCDNYVYV